MVRHDWTSSAQISLESAMRKPRKVVPITREERKNAQVRSERTAPVKEEIRILTCRLSPASMTFHLGPPLLLRHTASKPHAQAGKLLPVHRIPAKHKSQTLLFGERLWKLLTYGL
jgi:hypothetical protein